MPVKEDKNQHKARVIEFFFVLRIFPCENEKKSFCQILGHCPLVTTLMDNYISALQWLLTIVPDPIIINRIMTPCKVSG